MRLKQIHGFAIFSLLLLFMSGAAPALAAPYITVGNAKAEKAVVAMPAILTTDAGLGSVAKQVGEQVQNDLIFMDLFKFMDTAAFVEPAGAGITLDRFKLSDWTSIGAKLLLKSQLSNQGGNLVLEAYLYDTFGAHQLLGKRYVATPSDAKSLAHTLANNIVETLTNLPGVFLTKIAMTCEQKGGRKEIFMMNFDGTEAKQVTQHHSIAFSPAWSPDGTKLAYSVYTKHRDNIKNIDLFEFDFKSSSFRLLSNRKGINSGASYAPDGKKVALTMSFLGNPELFLFDPSNKTVTRLTKTYGFDVDPTFSPDGQSLAFISSRSGPPMVYRMNLDGSEVKRLTYAGNLNATPTWSPTNTKIAFAGWVDRHFDIFMMNPDGSNIERLTSGQGSNEDPFFSPDGNFIVFSSNRTGQHNIYVMNVDGTFVKRLTYGMGNCAAPKWSPIPK